MKKPFIIVAFLFCVLLLQCCKRSGIEIPDMSRSFSLRSKKPMGASIAFQLFKWQFHQYLVYQPKKNFRETFKDIDDSRNLYFILTDRLMLSDDDTESLLNYANSGNQLFISAASVDRKLLDTLAVKVTSYSLSFLFDSTGFPGGKMETTDAGFYNTALHGTDRYGFFYFPLQRRFTSFDSSVTQIIGLNTNNQPDCITFPYGNGRIFLHLHPEVFSNYFFLKNNNKEYAEKLLSYVSQNRNAVYWDDYYRMGLPPNESFSVFGVFLKYEPLRWALWLGIATLLLYLLAGSKRRQRPVPVLQTNTNSSVSFVETIGRLYLQKKDHHNIVHKMVTYFMERIRNHYYINTSQLNAAFFASLSGKSGVPQTEVKHLFEYIAQLQDAETITDLQLLELNNKMLLYFKY